jgi:hypothetical protein
MAQMHAMNLDIFVELHLQTSVTLAVHGCEW